MKTTNKKGAIGFAVETIVIIIISMVILVSGILFVRNIIAGGENIKAQLDLRTEAEIERLLLEQGKRVALPQGSKTVPRGEHSIFGLGVLNAESAGEFSIEVLSTNFVAQGTTEPISGPEAEALASAWPLYDTEKFELKQQEQRKEPILIQVPSDARLGTYHFKVTVLKDGLPYGHPQHFRVEVIA